MDASRPVQVKTLSDCIGVGNSANLFVWGCTCPLQAMGDEFDEVIGLGWMPQDQFK